MSTKFSVAFTIVNILLGTGPIILPSPFFDAGYILSVIWLTIIGLIGYITAEYIIEIISRSNYLKRKS
jgi:amino acid permease